MTDSRLITRMEVIALVHRQLENNVEGYFYVDRKQLTKLARDLPYHAKKWVWDEVQVVALDKELQEFLEGIIPNEGWQNLYATCHDLYYILKTE